MRAILTSGSDDEAAKLIEWMRQDPAIVRSAKAQLDAIAVEAASKIAMEPAPTRRSIVDAAIADDATRDLVGFLRVWDRYSTGQLRPARVNLVASE